MNSVPSYQDLPASALDGKAKGVSIELAVVLTAGLCANSTSRQGGNDV